MILKVPVVVLFVFLVQQIQDVIGVPSILPAEPKYLVGEDIDITCTTDNDPNDIEWYKESTDPANQLTDGGRIGIAINMPDQSILSISGLISDDSGPYICKQGGGTLSSTLTVFQVPTVDLVSVPANPRISQGNNITLTCTTNYQDKVKWLKNGEEINSGIKRIVITDNVLHIVNSELTDAGIYKCVVNITDDLQRGELVLAEDSVDVISEVDMSVSETAKREEGESVIIECNATSYPLSTITWLKNDKTLQHNPDGRVSIDTMEEESRHLVYTTLTIRRIETDDRGTYLCNASNGHSSNSINFELEVLDGMEALYIFFGTVGEVLIIIIIILIIEKWQTGQLPCGKSEKTTGN